MEIEVGKKYITRNGEVATITRAFPLKTDFYAFAGFLGDNTQAEFGWSRTGRFIETQEATYDLIKLAPEFEAAPFDLSAYLADDEMKTTGVSLDALGDFMADPDPLTGVENPFYAIGDDDELPGEADPLVPTFGGTAGIAGLSSVAHDGLDPGLTWMPTMELRLFVPQFVKAKENDATAHWRWTSVFPNPFCNKNGYRQPHTVSARRTPQLNGAMCRWWRHD